MTGPGGSRPVTSHDPAPRTALERASAQLQQRATDRWVEVANDVLENAMRASRGSSPVRAHAPSGPIHLGEQVIVAYLRRALDDALDGGAVGRIYLRVDVDEVLESVTIELFAQFGRPLLPIADRARAISNEVLDEMLGTRPPEITVTTLHVHVADVTRGDPHVVDPADE